MEIRAINPLRKSIKTCSDKGCNRVAHYSVFSEGVPNNFITFCCKPHVNHYMNLHKNLVNYKRRK